MAIDHLDCALELPDYSISSLRASGRLRFRQRSDYRSDTERCRCLRPLRTLEWPHHWLGHRVLHLLPVLASTGAGRVLPHGRGAQHHPGARAGLHE